MKRTKSIAKTEAKAATMALLESKYFRVTDPASSLGSPHIHSVPGAGAIIPTYNVSACAWSTLINHVGDTTTPLMSYPAATAQNIHQMHMLRLPTGPQGSIDGHFVTPVSAASKWTIARKCVDETIHSTSDGLYDNWQKALPMRVRMTRVTPKIAPGIATEVDPGADLFLDQQGNAHGVRTQAFSVDDLRHGKINTRKYTVLNDKQMVLHPPLVAGHNIAYTNRECPNSALSGQQSSAMVSYTHQLTAKKGGKVRYNNPSTSDENPDEGQRREYIFVHSC